MNDVSFSHDSSMVAAAADDGAVYVWDWRSGDALAVLHRHGDAVKSVEFMRGDKQLVTAADDGTAAVFDCTTCGDVDSVLDKARARDDARSRGVATPFD